MSYLKRSRPLAAHSTELKILPHPHPSKKSLFTLLHFFFLFLIFCHCSFNDFLLLFMLSFTSHLQTNNSHLLSPHTALLVMSFIIVRLMQVLPLLSHVLVFIRTIVLLFRLFSRFHYTVGRYERF